MSKNNLLKFNKQFFRDFWQLFKPYWTSEEKCSAFVLLALGILCTIFGVRASVTLNGITKDFYDALQNFNHKQVLGSLLHYIIMLAILILVYGYGFYFNGLLAIRWRRWLTKHYLKKWLHNHSHYHMQLRGRNMDNPDQRISEDLDTFTSATMGVFFMIFESLFSGISFGIILWGLSGSLSIAVGHHHVSVHGYLLWAALFFGLLAIGITQLIGKKLANLDYQQQHFNADFRFSLVKLRESSEQVALYQGERNEDKRFDHFFNRIYDNFIKMLSLKKRLMFFTSGYSMGLYFLGILIAIPLYFQKKLQIGGMMQVTGAFSSVVSAFLSFANSFSFFTEWRAVVSRLSEFNQCVDFSQHTAVTGKHILINDGFNGGIVINNFTLSLPNGTVLLSNLNLNFYAGSSYLLCGPSRLGKSTLLRALAGLWPFYQGEIYRQKNKSMFFLPQKPYFPIGSFKEALIYPGNQDIGIDIIHDTLLQVGLTKFQHSLDEIKDWEKELSLGEQQLVAFARLFLHKPDIIFLDESTSALDEEKECFVYKAMRKFLPQAALISVGHRSSLRQFHENIITLTSEAKTSDGLTLKVTEMPSDLIVPT